MPGSAEKPYIFASASEYEQERLKLLNEVYNPKSQEMLRPWLRPGISILEIGPGNGELGAWMVQTAGKGTQYTAIETSQEAIANVSRLIPEAELINASVANIEDITQLYGRRFDLIYFRWVLAYTSKEQFNTTLAKLYSLLSDTGRLVCEECNVYKVSCIDKQHPDSKTHDPAIEAWLALSRDVDRAFQANFELGKRLKQMLVEVTHNTEKVVVEKFQPALKDPHTKRILFFGMSSARQTLIEQKIREPQEFDALTQQLEALADNEEIDILYVKNTIATVCK
ncbi:Putative methyltransferase (plasmid) [Legionella adelaidensis]|uniref:Methyltransferase n=1 Tax=Legionella adelaidensis TaxID=45056 RepID=A0A0W0R5F3_9GAMM|nr:class I SAM-dependent methyltransferase [Legionella adelaidensis]KTC66261.1 putative methyltransferase [Legionella adelaidensis]VEH84857.1 Putative methyltransferase [Legionella adelaidensis]